MLYVEPLKEPPSDSCRFLIFKIHLIFKIFKILKWSDIETKIYKKECD